MLDKAVEIISKEIDIMQEKYAYIVVCGDIITGGIPSNYKKAKEIMDHFKTKLGSRNLRFLFVPGNHDLCGNSFRDFDTFTKSYNNKLSFDNSSINIWEDKEEDTRFILLNTSYHKDCKSGKFDNEELKKLVLQNRSGVTKPTITIMHHTLMSRYNDDRSAIDNAYEFINYLGNTSSVALLHGHTHGVSNIVVGNNCRIVGVGSLFKIIQNCNNQFNIIDIGNGIIQNIDNYIYRADEKNFLREPLFINREKYFSGSKMSEIYSKIKNDVFYRKVINNLYTHINTKYQDYAQDMMAHFKDDMIVAEEWLAHECPNTLYYNHGRYMIVNNTKGSGIDYIIETLKIQPTSTHAIIPLINLKDVVENPKGRYPGLCSIQFMLKDKKLYCSVYMRSLETSKFMRINLAEIFILIKRINSQIFFDYVDISIFAFNVAHREKFNPFRKSKIDMMTDAKIANIIYEKKYRELVGLLKNKFELNMTEVDTTGIESILAHMNASRKYDEDIINLLNEIVTHMNELECEQRKTSNYSEMDGIQNRISDKAKILIEKLQKKYHSYKRDHHGD